MTRFVALLVLTDMLSACGQLGFEFVEASVADADLTDVHTTDTGTLLDASQRDGGLDGSRDVAVPDAARPDAALLDSGADVPDAGLLRCDEWTEGNFTFDVVGEVTTGTITGERGEMRISADGSTMYFGFDGDVYQAPRVSELVFEPATPVPGLDTETATFGANLSADSLTALVMVDGGGHVDIWRYERPTASNAFVPVRALDELNTTGEDWDPLVTADGLAVYFGRSLDDVGSVVFARRVRPDDEFTVVRTFFDEPKGVFANPSFNDDETVLVLNHREAGRSHLHYSTRPDRSGTFAEVTLLPGVQERTETEPFLTPDGCEVYYTAQSDTDGYRMLLARYRRL